MPTEPDQTTTEVEKLLSLQDRLQLSALQERLNHIGEGAMLALAGVDSVDLGKLIAAWIPAQSSRDCITHLPESPKDAQAFISNLQQLDPQKLHIVCLFTDMSADEQVVAGLVFNRDYIPRLHLKIIFIVSHTLLNAIIEKAYDFYAIAGFSHFFNDFSQLQAEHFLTVTSPAAEEYEKQCAELEQYRGRADASDEGLLTRLVRTALAAQEISLPDDALALYLEAHNLVQRMNDVEHNGLITGNIGVICRDNGDFDKALDYLVQALEIERKIDDRQGTASALNNIGLVYLYKRDHERALIYLFQALEIDYKIGNQQGIASDLLNIGIVYKDQDNYDQALKYFTQALDIDLKIGDLLGAASNLSNIGLIYQNKGELEQALKYLFQALEIDRKNGNQQGTASVLNNIGLVYYDKGDLEQAFKYQLQALAINYKINYLQGVATALGNIGLIYQDKGDLDKALKHHQQALEIDNKINFQQGTATNLGN